MLYQIKCSRRTSRLLGTVARKEESLLAIRNAKRNSKLPILCSARQSAWMRMRARLSPRCKCSGRLPSPKTLNASIASGFKFCSKLQDRRLLPGLRLQQHRRRLLRLQRHRRQLLRLQRHRRRLHRLQRHRRRRLLLRHHHHQLKFQHLTKYYYSYIKCTGTK